jgi:hypothetical protein
MSALHRWGECQLFIRGWVSARGHLTVLEKSKNRKNKWLQAQAPTARAIDWMHTILTLVSACRHISQTRLRAFQLSGFLNLVRTHLIIFFRCGVCLSHDFYHQKHTKILAHIRAPNGIRTHILKARSWTSRPLKIEYHVALRSDAASYPKKRDPRQKTTYATNGVSSKIQILTTINTCPATQHLLHGYDKDTRDNHSLKSLVKKTVTSCDQLLCTVLWQQC